MNVVWSAEQISHEEVALGTGYLSYLEGQRLDAKPKEEPKFINDKLTRIILCMTNIWIIAK